MLALSEEAARCSGTGESEAAQRQGQAAARTPRKASFVLIALVEAGFQLYSKEVVSNGFITVQRLHLLQALHARQVDCSSLLVLLPSCCRWCSLAFPL